jgi:hypothetical protein
MSLVLVVLAGLIVVAELLRHDHGTERWILSCVMLVIALLGRRLVNDLRRPVQL